MSGRRHFVSLLVLVPVLVTLAFAGPPGLSNYSESRFPYSGSIYFGSADGNYTGRHGFMLDDTGSRKATHFYGDPDDGSGGWESQAGSPTDPTVVYYYHSGFKTIDVIKFDGAGWRLQHRIPRKGSVDNSIHSFVTAIRDRNGSDLVFFRPSRESISAIIDSDGDSIADQILDRNGDTYDDEIRFGDFPVAAISPTGTAYGVDGEDLPYPADRAYFVLTIVDSDGDLIPDTPAWPADSRGRLVIPGLDYVFSQGVWDAGADRLIGRGLYPGFPVVINIDGDGFPVPSSIRPLAGGGPGNPGPLFELYTYENHVLLHDGSMAAWWIVRYTDTGETDLGVYILDDVNFDGIATILKHHPDTELIGAFTESDFPDTREYAHSPLVPALAELEGFAGGLETITFADFGIWPDGRSFTFRQAGIDRTSVSVSLDGLLSFIGPVTASPSLAVLEATPGLVAPAWSDQWDTSQVRVFAGCAPVQRRFADGSSAAALSFAIEWRGLVSPNGKRTSLRCLLLEDGSFRVDYGAMETGDMPLVVGYSTDGPGTIVPDDLSDNSWGGTPAGTLEESKLGEEFGVAKPFDLSHKWIRFAGYGDVRGPRPELIDVVLKKGNRIQMKDAGSNIQTGATLVVDGTETFQLAKSATGSKWTVKRKALSAPGAKSVESIWADGAAHSIVVVNPDGTRSLATELR